MVPPRGLEPRCVAIKSRVPILFGMRGMVGPVGVEPTSSWLSGRKNATNLAAW